MKSQRGGDLMAGPCDLTEAGRARSIRIVGWGRARERDTLSGIRAPSLRPRSAAAAARCRPSPCEAGACTALTLTDARPVVSADPAAGRSDDPTTRRVRVDRPGRAAAEHLGGVSRDRAPVMASLTRLLIVEDSELLRKMSSLCLPAERLRTA